MQAIPVIEKNNGQWELLVDGKPFTMLAGELHNSSSSDLDYMEESVWPYLRDLNLNSVLLAVTWEALEPEEGCFDFSLVDGILQQARREGLRIGILWFGLWKNGISSYVPGWVKRDTKRFPRVQTRGGQPLDIVTPLSAEAVQADARAFVALMQHLKEVDEEERTVILMQVENEVGILGSDRDYSPLAQEHYGRPVPGNIAELFGKNGTWEEAFGEDAPEYFMEYAYACALETIAAGGKSVYPLPMITNAWLRQFPWRPGTYPSGGPTAEFRTIWKSAAPSITVNAPDVYVSDFHEVCRLYVGEDNPLLIPEHRRDIRNISHLFYAIGAYVALCFSPFGIEDFLTPSEKLKGLSSPQVMKMLNIDPAAWNCDKTGAFLRESYGLLSEAMLLLRESRRAGKVHAFLRASEHEKGTILNLAGCDLRIDYLDRGPDTPKAAGIVIETEDGTLYVMGVNFRYSLMSPKNSAAAVGIAEYSEGRFKDGRYIRGRMLNGDERFSMIQTELPAAQCLKWFRY